MADTLIQGQLVHFTRTATPQPGAYRVLGRDGREFGRVWPSGASGRWAAFTFLEAGKFAGMTSYAVEALSTAYRDKTFKSRASATKAVVERALLGPRTSGLGTGAKR